MVQRKAIDVPMCMLYNTCADTFLHLRLENIFVVVLGIMIRFGYDLLTLNICNICMFYPL